MDWICTGLEADWSAIANLGTLAIAGLAYCFARGEVRRHRFLRAGDAAMTLMNRGLSLVSGNIRILSMVDKGAGRDAVEAEVQKWKEELLLFNIDSQRVGTYFDDDSAEGYVISETAKRFLLDANAALEAKDRQRNTALAVRLRFELGPFVRGPNREERARIKKAGAEIKASHEGKGKGSEGDAIKSSTE